MYICVYIYIYIYIVYPRRQRAHSLPSFGWHYLSDATCLMRPRLFYVLFAVSRITVICCNIHHLKKSYVRQVVLDKWVPLIHTFFRWDRSHRISFQMGPIPSSNTAALPGATQPSQEQQCMNQRRSPTPSYVYIYIYTHVCVCVYIYIYVCMYVYVCVYIYIYVYIHVIHIILCVCTYIHIYTHIIPRWAVSRRRLGSWALGKLRLYYYY